MKNILKTLAAVIIFANSLQSPAVADGPADNDPKKVRRIPKLGIEPTDAQRLQIQARLARLKPLIDALKKRDDAKTRELLPDVQIYYRAVQDALTFQEFLRQSDFDAAIELLDEGYERADQLLKREAPWTNQRGWVVRGFVSKIDGSVQPYGLVIPDSYTHRTAGRYRVDIWLHGRGESTGEVGFLQQRRKSAGIFTPPDTIVLHPYGRYSNAFKFAGEVDVLEALESVKQRYRVDEDRIGMRGFSMGGAGCWQFAVHYSDKWFAANPGAGFSETPEFLKFFQKETLNPTWFEKKLWHWYDCTDWAINLHQCPTVAYSGELDIQKQAADIMESRLEEVDVDLVHIIGPKTKHRYHPDAQNEVEERLSSIAKNAPSRTYNQITFSTYTLKYNKMGWITVDGLNEHWKQSRVYAHVAGDNSVYLRTTNVSRLTINFPPGTCPLSQSGPLVIDAKGDAEETQLKVPGVSSDQSWLLRLHTDDKGNWRIRTDENPGLAKRHNLQGPIDDAFMDSFIFVRPTGEARSELVGNWSNAELERAIEHWRRHFRGYARVKDDTQINDEDIASSNLVLWGDPSSNAILKRIADKLPIQWNADDIVIGKRKFESKNRALIAIYPNPLNPEKYVVLNSSFTFREYAYLNNARQVAKLPDWAIVDLRTPPDSLWPGKIVDADFFDERWQLKPARKVNSLD